MDCCCLYMAEDCLFVSTYAPMPEQMAAVLVQGSGCLEHRAHVSWSNAYAAVWVTAVSTVVTEV